MSYTQLKSIKDRQMKELNEETQKHVKIFQVIRKHYAPLYPNKF